MNIADIKLGDHYQYYFYNSDKQLSHFQVEVVKLKKKQYALSVPTKSFALILLTLITDR